MGVAARGTGAVVGDCGVLEWTDGWGSRGRPGCWLGDCWKHKSNFSRMEEMCQGGRTNRQTEGQKDKSSPDLSCLSLPTTSASSPLSPWTPGVSSHTYNPVLRRLRQGD